MSQLDELKKMTVVVADSGDFEAVSQFKPEDATTNPSLILKAAEISHYQNLIDDAIKYAVSQGGSDQTRLINASDKLAVNFGLELLKVVPGRVSTEVDARFSFDRGMSLSKARKLIRMYEEQGIDRSRILIKLAATWQGIRAAEELEREGINCNLTLIFSFAQARACAEAGVYLISPFVGRITDWYQARSTSNSYDVASDKGVKSVTQIYNYFKERRYPTIIMGASFRRTDQIVAIAGCDRLTISPGLLEVLKASNAPLNRMLTPEVPYRDRPSAMTEAEFYWEHHSDAMAVEKLAEGIRQFGVDQIKLELMIKERFNEVEAQNV
ncbi:MULTISPECIES: transaldolase [unclassified Pantoea]|uniref:transaldolase n=1 Tax=unclassified Pantoea TaxID=2630326 RepID=UPI001CD309B9|nr:MULTISPECIES: transaldolase [unclassified Pantoea]MCA1179482.1 transaldolase [Pantoea sp. alder69]MCA1251735.1 transaldolase [Pantoea sp. alder70]MCA1267928.1 transaldolase [Pantoea sp. alder81]